METQKTNSFDPNAIKANLSAIIGKIDEMRLLCGKFDGLLFEDAFIRSLRKKLRELYNLTKKH